MESNGIPNQIHISEATANALMAFHKSGWLTERPDKIVAKGKGEMTTYFAVPTPSSEVESNSKASFTDMVEDMNGSLALDITV